MRRALALLLIIAAPAHSAERSSKVRAQFQRLNPCPANGKPDGPCPKYVVDHKFPLCAGGKDELPNLQWQTEKDALVKDRVEIALCAALRKIAALKKASHNDPP